MIRNFLSLVVERKSYLMLLTCVIYITGLTSYFTGTAVLAAFLIMIFGIFAILKNYLSPKLVMFWYFVFFLAFFNVSLREKDSDALSQISPQNATVYGQIVSIPNSVGDKTKFFFNVFKISYNGTEKKLNAKTLVNVYAVNGKNSKFSIGNKYSIKGKLRTPFEASNPSQFDYGKYLRNFNDFTLFYTEADYCNDLKAPLSVKWKFLQWLNNIRNDIIKTHAQYLKSPNLELLGGIVFGDDAIAPPDGIKSSFVHSGLLHILAASGMNVALIYGIWFFMLRKLKAPFKISVLSGIFVVIFYSMMTGLGPSVVRAAFMLIFILIGKLIDRDADSIALLAFVALLMLLYNPSYINDVSFQLSFIVTLGLLTMAPLVFERVKILPNWLSGAIFIPIIAQIWIAPVQMYYFNSFSLYSIFANIAILPFITIVSFGGFISAVLALIKPLANTICFIFDFVLNPVLNILVAISNYFASLPHSLIQVPQPNFWQILFYYALVISLTLILKIGKNKKIILTAVLLFIGLILSSIQFPNHNLETIVFDVQNADAFLIKTPQNKYFLIDSGKMSYKNGKTQAKMIILEYLKDKGIKNIQGFIITHFDSDHAGGAVDLIEKLNIKNVYLNSLNDKSNIAGKIYASVRNKKNTKLIKAKNNEIIYKEGNLKIKNFIANLKGEEFENENSLVTLVSKKDFDELFMGDAGILAFERIKSYLPQNIEILKVGHHGAKNVIDKAFIQRIKPKEAIISTGLNNYGHPNGVTLDILRQNKIKVLRTDRQNSIKIDEDIKGDYKIYSYSGGKYVLLKD